MEIPIVIVHMYRNIGDKFLNLFKMDTDVAEHVRMWPTTIRIPLQYTS